MQGEETAYEGGRGGPKYFRGGPFCVRNVVEEHRRQARRSVITLKEKFSILLPVSSSSSAALLQPGYDSFIAPPLPLPPQYTSSLLQRANTAPDTFPRNDLKSSDTIMEDKNEGDGESESVHVLKHRNSKSSGGGGGGGIYRQGAVEDEVLQRPPSPPGTPPQNNCVPPIPSSKNKGMMYWEYFTNDVLTPTLAEVDENRMEREEMGRKMIEEERAK